MGSPALSGAARYVLQLFAGKFSQPISVFHLLFPLFCRAALPSRLEYKPLFRLPQASCSLPKIAVGASKNRETTRAAHIKGGGRNLRAFAPHAEVLAFGTQPCRSRTRDHSSLSMICFTQRFSYSFARVSCCGDRASTMTAGLHDVRRLPGRVPLRLRRMDNDGSFHSFSGRRCGPWGRFPVGCLIGAHYHRSRRFSPSRSPDQNTRASGSADAMECVG